MHVAADGPVLVIGPGALGLLVAARLAAAGQDVVLAARTKEAARPLSGGIRAIDHDGSEVTAAPPVVHAPRQLDRVPSLVVLATKCQAAVPALEAWLPVIGDDAPVVCLQNGVIGDRLAPLLGDRHVECTVSIPATLESPGVTRQTAPGGLHIGPWPKARDRHDPKQFKQVARLLSHVAPVQGSDNMLGVKWTKLVVNSCITSLGVLTGTNLGRLLADARARQAFLRIAEEGHAAGRAAGVRFEAVAGFRPGLFAAPLPGRDLLLRALGRKYRRHHSSSLQSLERGQATEVDFLNGHIAATGAQHRIPTPVNDAVVRLVHTIESGKLAPGLGYLDLLPA